MEFFEELTDALMRRSGFSILVSIGVACVAGCGVQMPAGHAPAPELEAATYSGTIPCASCPGIHIVLTLFPDSTFRLRQTYLEAEDGRDQHFYELGRWMRAHDDRARLLLRDGTEGIWHVRFLAGGVLRMLDTEGNEVRSDLNYDLTRQPEVDPVSGPMRLFGMYVYLADAAAFTECLTGKRYPMAIEADHLALERAYLEARHQPGAAVPVTLEGRFVERVPEPGGAVGEYLLVERFDRVWPGETCERNSET